MSWSTFSIVLFSIAIIYNMAIIFLYFKGDVSSLLSKKGKQDSLVLSTPATAIATDKKSFVGLVQPDMDRSDMTNFRTEPSRKIGPTLKGTTNGILVSDLENCLNEVGRNLKDHDPLSENTKELIKDIAPDGKIQVEYNYGQKIIEKRIDVFENIVQL